MNETPGLNYSIRRYLAGALEVFEAVAREMECRVKVGGHQQTELLVGEVLARLWVVRQ